MKTGAIIHSKCIVTVIFLQVLESCAYNLQHADSNIQDTVQTITIDDYTEKIHVQYPALGTDFEQPDQTSLDSWSVVWYIASFGGLIVFFLIVSCSEWCCRRNARRNCQRNTHQQTEPQIVQETPPPSYDHFAPPSYDELWVGSSSRGRRGEKSEYDIYVVPVHALGTLMEEARREDAPPSYQTASAGFQHSTDHPQVNTSNATS